ncbi:U-scoloptoxin(01)-Er1a-like [Pollicipes pollicipes]|uniref:U-scoloptoxin(01)-Er1a-like n=1 Tax=Pollicipes pollicipes TaxID=41117 RepID=UPI001884CA41|nr:U-scoloptoxin(01)-Er1a-like [Pollicipes pollicipes]XP_037093033.1 U-scoloptoxin(01)-Er1a-like [Pollicipes pollicipes]
MSRVRAALLLGLAIVAVSAHVAKRQVGSDSYPTYASVPDNIAFTCEGQLPGYYADVDFQCQVWHFCTLEAARYSFLCPNQTVFNQQYRVCDWWYNVDCASSSDLAANNADLYKDADGNPI